VNNISLWCKAGDKEHAACHIQIWGSSGSEGRMRLLQGIAPAWIRRDPPTHSDRWAWTLTPSAWPRIFRFISTYPLFTLILLPFGIRNPFTISSWLFTWDNPTEQLIPVSTIWVIEPTNRQERVPAPSLFPHRFREWQIRFISHLWHALSTRHFFYLLVYLLRNVRKQEHGMQEGNNRCSGLCSQY
jgi:hypothetical protein